MNENKSKQNLRAFLSLFIALALTFVLAFATACGGSDESTSTSESTSSSEKEEETAKDEQTLSNGDFEFYATSGFPVSSSSIQWTRSLDGNVYNAKSSSDTSWGIIDTADEAFKALDSKLKPFYNSEDETFVNPRTPGYTEENGYPENDSDTEVNENGSKILMLRNKYGNGVGTAQYVKSAKTITLAPENCAKISVWVRTDELSSLQEYNDFGAYIKILNTVNSSIEPLVIKNINTESKWVNYVIYLKPSAFATTKYQVVLGLGMGDEKHPEELCEGFAFFDNVEYTIIDPKAYDEAAAIDTVALYNSDNQNILDKDDSAYNPSAFTINKAGAEYAGAPVNVKEDFSKKEEKLAILGEGNYNNVNPDTENNVVKNNSDEGYSAGYTADGIKIDDLNVPANSIYMSFDGAIGSSYTYTTQEFTLAAKKQIKISFMAKVSAKSYSTNASVVLVDGENDSTSFPSFTTDNLENEYHDNYIRYTFYVQNTYDTELTYKFKFSFGPTEMTVSSPTVRDLPIGYAIFTDFSFVDLTDSEYNTVDVSGNTDVKASLKGDYLNPEEDEDTEETEDYSEVKEEQSEYAFSITGNDYGTLSKEALPLTQFTSSYRTAQNGDSVIGLINSAFNYNYDANLSAALGKLENAAKTNHVQPIMIYNKEATAAGLIQQSPVTLSANTSYVFTVKVKALGDAKAYIYLIDTATTKQEAGNVEYSYLVFSTPDDNTLDKVEKNMFTIVKAGDTDDYVTVRFYIRTGDDEMKLRIEVWNGDRDGNDNCEGTVLVDSISTSTTGYATFEEMEKNYRYTEFSTYEYNQGRIYSYNDEYTESNKIADEYENADTYVVFAESEDGTVKFAKYDAFSKYNIVKTETESESESEPESNPNTDETIGSLVWLQITSLIIAIVLILVLIAIVIRKIVEKRKKKREKTKNYYTGYNKNTRRVPSHSDIEAPDDDGAEYDYGSDDDNKD